MDDRNASIRLSERPPGGGLSPPVRPQQTAAELAQLKLRELKHRARELGVSEDKIDALDEAKKARADRKRERFERRKQQALESQSTLRRTLIQAQMMADLLM